MTRYFFHTINNGSRHVDAIGDECASDAEMKDNAVGILVHMAQDELPDGDDHWFGIEVTDVDGRLIYSADLTLRSRWGSNRGPDPG